MNNLQVTNKKELDNIGIILTRAFHEEIYKDPNTIVRAYEVFTENLIHKGMQGYTKISNPTLAAETVSHALIVPLKVIKKAAESIKAGKSDYNPLEVASALAVFERNTVRLKSKLV